MPLFPQMFPVSKPLYTHAKEEFDKLSHLY